MKPSARPDKFLGGGDSDGECHSSNSPTATDKKKNMSCATTTFNLGPSLRLHKYSYNNYSYNYNNNNNLRFPKPFAHYFAVSNNNNNNYSDNTSSYSVGTLFSISTNHRSTSFNGSRSSSSPFFICSSLKSQPSVSLDQTNNSASRKCIFFFKFFYINLCVLISQII